MNGTTDDSKELAEVVAALTPPPTYRALKVASIVLRVCAVLYVIAAFYTTFLATSYVSNPAGPFHQTTVIEEQGMVAALGFLKETLLGFALYVSGELIRLGLDIKADLQSLKRPVQP